MKTGRKNSKADQHQRFVEMARALGADESGETFERAFREMVPPKEGRTVPAKRKRVRRRPAPESPKGEK